MVTDADEGAVWEYLRTAFGIEPEHTGGSLSAAVTRACNEAYAQGMDYATDRLQSKGDW
jgi:hypothetical protein